jgi:predicted  nucleic acid-binding Zn-ribbon protein
MSRKVIKTKAEMEREIQQLQEEKTGLTQEVTDLQIALVEVFELLLSVGGGA